MNQFKAIAAMATNRVIGFGNQIPWRVPEDFQWFKRRTMGQILLMGRKTFASIGRPLPGRETIVLSRSELPIPGVRVVNQVRQLLSSDETRDIFVCGGAEVYAQLLPYCSELFLTLIKREVAGDVYFPSFETRFEPIEIIQDTPEFSITRYRNQRLAQISMGDGKIDLGDVQSGA